MRRICSRVFCGMVITLAVAILAWYFAQAFFTSPTIHFQRTTLQGNSFTTQNTNIRANLVNFWATSCPTCVQEIPHLMQTADQFRNQGVQVVGIAMSYDRPEYVRSFTHQHQLNYAIVLDTDGELAQLFGNIRLTPTSFLLDEKGHIVKQYLGKIPADTLQQDIQALLHQATPES